MNYSPYQQYPPYQASPNQNPNYNNPYYQQNPYQSQPQQNFTPQPQQQQIPQYGGGANFRRFGADPNKIASQGDDLYDQGRSSFIRKVYILLALSLLVTSLVCLWAMISPSFKSTFCNVPAMAILSVLLFVISIVVACCYQQMERFGLPIFVAFVIVESLLVGIMCAQV